MEPYFEHERLEVYQAARELNRAVRHRLAQVRRGHSDSRDNLTRAAKSVTRNIAEGSARWSVPDKVNFYHIARASAAECAASIDELVDHGLVAEEKTLPTRALLGRVVAMLTALVRSLQSRRASPPT
jgi:four helix bundle protein